MEGNSGDGTVYVDGVVVPGVHRGTDPATVLARLRHRNVLASVGRQDPDAETIAQGIHPSRFPVLLCVATTPDQRVLLHTPTGVHPGPHLAELVSDLAEATGCEVEIGGMHRTAPPPRIGEAAAGDAVAFSPAAATPSFQPEILPPTQPEPDPTNVVVMTRATPDKIAFVPGLAGAPIEAAMTGHWWVIRFEEPPPKLDEVTWGGRDLPVLVLSQHLGVRHLSVLTEEGSVPGEFTLTRLPDMRVPYSPGELSSDAARVAAVLSSMPMQPGPQVRSLLEQPAFEHSDIRFVAPAVQSPSDSGWFARVLDSLGLPTLGAEAFEGAPMSDSHRFSPGNYLRVNKEFNRYARATDVVPGRPWHNLMARRPVLHLVLTVLRLLLAVGVLVGIVWLGLNWWRIIIGVVMLLAVWDCVATFRVVAERLRRRRQPPTP